MFYGTFHLLFYCCSCSFRNTDTLFTHFMILSRLEIKGPNTGIKHRFHNYLTHLQWTSTRQSKEIYSTLNLNDSCPHFSLNVWRCLPEMYVTMLQTTLDWRKYPVQWPYRLITCFKFHVFACSFVSVFICFGVFNVTL